MPQRRFDAVRERLLRGGVAPRRVRRYLRELSDHHHDALHAELAKGTPFAAAHEAAWARLGTEDSLAQPWLVPLSAVFGPRELVALGEGLRRAAVMLALSIGVQPWLRRLGISDVPTPSAA